METNSFVMTYDYHTHTTYSHGKGSIEDNVKAAVEKGLKGIAITDHGPGHLTYGLKRADLPKMRSEVEALKAKYPIEIYLGVEANIVSSGNGLDILKSEFSDYDFVIAGYHYGVKDGYCIANWLEHHLAVSGAGAGASRRAVSGTGTSRNAKKLKVLNTEMTLNAIYKNDIKILTHPGDKGQFDIMAIAKACQETDTLMEISTWHKHLTFEELQLLRKTENRFIISSDAHTPARVGDFEEGLRRALAAGIEPERIVNIKAR